MASQDLQRTSTPSIGLLVLLTLSFCFLIMNGALLSLSGERRLGGLVLAGLGVAGLLFSQFLFWRARARKRRAS